MSKTLSQLAHYRSSILSHRQLHLSFFLWLSSPSIIVTNRGSHTGLFGNEQNMNVETKKLPSSVATADEAINLIDENTPVPISSSTLEPNEKNKSAMRLTRKLLIQHRLMRWCAFILSLGTLFIIWRYVSILILAVWLSNISRPLLEWLVNHL